MHGHDDARILAALALVDRDGVRQGQLVEIAEVVGHFPVVHLHADGLLGGVYGRNSAQVAVVDPFVVVIPQLEHPVPDAEDPAPAQQFCRPVARRVQRRLQGGVELPRADGPAVHGREHLDVRKRIEPVLAGQAPLRQVYDEMLQFGRVLLGEEEEILRAIRRRRQVRKLAAIHPVCVRDDPALCRLAEDGGQADRGDARNGQEVLQNRPERELDTGEIGALVMNELKRLDKVAYVRFASVYRDFRDIGEFMAELSDLVNSKE